MKKVLVNYLGRTNAGPLIALNMAEALCDNGYEVYCIVSSQVSNKDEWEKNPKFKYVIFIDTYASAKELISSGVRFFLKGRRSIKDSFRGVNFDYIINPMHHLWASFVVSLFPNSNVISLCHDPIPHEGESRIERMLINRLMRLTDKYVVLSRKFIQVIIKEYNALPEDVFYIPLGRLDYYKKIQAENKAKMSSNEVTFLFFGRIEPYKGLSVLVKAYKRITTEFENVKLVIAGKGDISTEISGVEKLENVQIFNRYIDDSEVGNFFDSPNTIVVLPYISASQSGVIAIAVEYGNTVIASRTGGLVEQLDDGKVGLFFAAGDDEDLYYQMKKCITDKNIIEKQKKQMEELKENLDWKTVIGKLMNEIEGMRYNE